jgi:5-methylcytosine-specific restriction endonuclease McrA
MGDRSSTRRSREFREELKAVWMAQNTPCRECGLPIDWTAEKNTPNAFELDHIHAVKHYPHLEFERSNAAPTHHKCNRHKSAGAGVTAGITSEAW